MVQRAQPDVLVLDLGLPDLDGLLVCRQIRRTSAVPIVMLTKRSGAEAAHEGLAAGAHAYVTKLFDADEVLAHVRALIGKDSGA